MKKLILALALLFSANSWAQYGQSSHAQPSTDASPQPLSAQTANPSAVSGIGWIYGKTAAGAVELFYEDSLGNVTQITSAGAIPLTGPFIGDVYASSATGVKVSGDGDGAITFLGMGNGFDEDLTLNLDDTENTGVVSSSTGLNALSFSSINLKPVANDGASLGVSGTAWSDLFLADGGVLNWNNGSATLTYDTGNNFFQFNQQVKFTQGADFDGGTDITGVGDVNATRVIASGSIEPDADGGANIGDSLLGFGSVYVSDIGVFGFGDSGSSFTANGAGRITVDGDLKMLDLNASRLLSLDADGDIDDFITTANLAASVDAATGSGALVFGTEPTFTTSASFGSTGVKVSDDGDGAITFLGLGNGTDESFTMNLDDVANQVSVTTSTGVLLFDWDAIALDATIGLVTPRAVTASQVNVSSSAGVRLTGDGDGAITFLGLGNGTDEDLTLNLDDVANTVGVSSSTGVTTVDYGTITVSTPSINFGGTSLANYVETTNCTPTVTLVGGAGNTVPQYATTVCRATRIGDRMFLDVYLNGDGGNEGAGTGQLNIGLLVAGSASLSGGSIGSIGVLSEGVLFYDVRGTIDAGGTTVKLFNGVGTNALTGNDQSDTTRNITLHFDYEL